MPPKKSKAAAGAPVSASQPLPTEAPRPQRTSARKRRHSDGSDVSSVAETSGVKSAAKKRKRGRPTKNEPEVIVEEEEQIIESSEPMAPVCATPGDEAQAGAEAEAGDEIEVSQTVSKHVHFGGDSQRDDDYEEVSTAANITPHPRGKMPIKRRTISPNAGTESKRFRTASTRTSLPPSLSQDEHDPARVVQNLNFTSLHDLLGDKIRQLMAKKNAHRNSNMAEIDVDMDDGEDMLVLDSQEEVNYPRLPQTPRTPLLKASQSDRTSTDSEEFAGESSSRKSLTRQWEQERRAFQDAILALNEVADKARADLQILDIELKALGFSGAESLDIVASIRESFAHVREELERELPGTIPDDATTEDVVEILAANVKEFADRLRTADGELNEKSTLINNLGEQVNALVNRLAEKEVRLSGLREQWRDLDVGNEAKAKDIEDLEGELEAMTEDRDQKEMQRDAEQERANELAAEKTDFENSVTRLSESLQKYRDEEERLTETVTRMEEDHRATVAAMNKERQETVQDLEDRLDIETTARGEAEARTDEQQARLEDLEARVKTIETARETLVVELETVKSERDNELETSEDVQKTLEEKEAVIEDLGGRVGKLESELEELTDELETLRGHNETEKRQREAAEQDLDDRNQEIDTINHTLQERGKEANSLRQKLFEVQQKNDERMKEMEVDAIERDEQHQAELIKEVEKRETAEALAEERDVSINDLKEQLETVEQQMRDLIAEKDAAIKALEDEADEKDVIIQDLREDIRNAQDNYETTAQQQNERAQELEGSVAVLQETITQHEESIRTLEREAVASTQDHDDQTEERDAAIAQLNARIAELETSKSELEHQKAGLERRVNEEAEAMLLMQEDKENQIDELRETIRGKQSKILVVEEKAKAADERWQEVLDARDEEIGEMRVSATTTGQSVEALKQANEEIMRKFRAHVERSGSVVGALQDRIRELNEQADADGEGLKNDGEDALREIEVLMRDANAEQEQEVVHQEVAKVVKKGKGRKSKSRGFADSGIGLDGEAEAGGQRMLAH